MKVALPSAALSAEEQGCPGPAAQDAQDPPAPVDVKREFLKLLSSPARGILSRLSLKWGQQKAFAQPGRLVTKLVAVVERSLCSNSTSAAEQARRPFLREVKQILIDKHQSALNFARAVIQDIEDGSPFMTTSVHASSGHNGKWSKGDSLGAWVIIIYCSIIVVPLQVEIAPTQPLKSN